MFPNATILHMVRDPLDTCVSCFALRFAKGHEWSNRLSDLAHFYSQYRAMMDHWNKVLPGRIVDVSYEALTRDFEPEVRKLLDACELPWEDQVLSFVGADRAVRTASAAQVREGITTTSVARWKRFEPHLDELKNALKDYL